MFFSEWKQLQTIFLKAAELRKKTETCDLVWQREASFLSDNGRGCDRKMAKIQ